MREKAKESKYNLLTIHADKLDWHSNSQGPYPTWYLSLVFNSIKLDSVKLGRCIINFQTYFKDKGKIVWASVDLYNEKNDKPYWGRGWFNSDNIEKYLEYLKDADENVYNKVVNCVNAAQDYIDYACEKIKNAYASYTDYGQIREFLLADKCKFTVDENGNVIPYKVRPY